MLKTSILERNINTLGFFLSMGKILNELINKYDTIVERLPVHKIDKKKMKKRIK